MDAFSARFCAFMFSPFRLSEAEVECAWRPRQHASGHVTWTLSGTKNARRRERGPGLGVRRRKHQQRASRVSGKSLKQQRKVGLKRGGENGVLAAEVVRGKNSKTFQFLSFPFIASQAVETGMRGDPKKSAHCVVNKPSCRIWRIHSWPPAYRSLIVAVWWKCEAICS